MSQTMLRLAQQHATTRATLNAVEARQPQAVEFSTGRGYSGPHAVGLADRNTLKVFVPGIIFCANLMFTSSGETLDVSAKADGDYLLCWKLQLDPTETLKVTGSTAATWELVRAMFNGTTHPPQAVWADDCPKLVALTAAELETAILVETNTTAGNTGYVVLAGFSVATVSDQKQISKLVQRQYGDIYVPARLSVCETFSQDKDGEGNLTEFHTMVGYTTYVGWTLALLMQRDYSQGYIATN